MECSARVKGPRAPAGPIRGYANTLNVRSSPASDARPQVEGPCGIWAVVVGRQIVTLGGPGLPRRGPAGGTEELDLRAIDRKKPTLELDALALHSARERFRMFDTVIVD